MLGKQLEKSLKLILDKILKLHLIHFAIGLMFKHPRGIFRTRRTSKIEPVAKIVKRLSVVNYFYKKLHLR